MDESPYSIRWTPTHPRWSTRKKPGDFAMNGPGLSRVTRIDALPEPQRDRLLRSLREHGFHDDTVAAPPASTGPVDLILTHPIQETSDIAALVARSLEDPTLHAPGTSVSRRPPIDFERDVQPTARAIAQRLLERRDAITTALEHYETHDAIQDELNASLDLLTHLDQNRDYFVGRIRGVTSFLPLNQPLYAACCFGVVPALMSESVVIRPPTAMRTTFARLEEALALPPLLPQLRVAYDTDKKAFIQARREATEAVIFTGTLENAEQVRRAFGPEPLFIFNGSGHNPLVVTPTADVARAVASAMHIVLHNQGQDCSAPNALLVHRSVLPAFCDHLVQQLHGIRDRVGPFHERRTLVGPNTDPEAPLLVARRLAQWARQPGCTLLHGGEVNPVSGIIWPTVLVAPLRQRALPAQIGLTEWYAPVFLIHPYDDETQLPWYFEHPAYRRNAMYVTVFGQSPYLRSLVDRGLHTPENLLVDTDLRRTERGFLPFGGNGLGASHLHHRGRCLPGATLPQRDIYLHLVRSSPP
ncbi:aldehyde dehydrogenase family protein [Chondromyces crocatus]|uniref:Aldehyde dehydrogenase domain-containing protein n=1 Tax=Chondromyces crocatus TaxID=52 RepID=A0A0K1EAJ1_CHOCO|nr:aldehyde dehydrogenase family protein [Chondromyces crocatus]AKT37692.1 uncharacterized protein CMC5_018340 [Chondromyces crocatus]